MIMIMIIIDVSSHYKAPIYLKPQRQCFAHPALLWLILEWDKSKSTAIKIIVLQNQKAVCVLK